MVRVDLGKVALRQKSGLPNLVIQNFLIATARSPPRSIPLPLSHERSTQVVCEVETYILDYGTYSDCTEQATVAVAAAV